MAYSKNNMSAHARLLQHGLALANRRMLERDAMMERTLIFGNMDGTVKKCDAKEFLAEAMKSEWWKDHFGKV